MKLGKHTFKTILRNDQNSKPNRKRHRCYTTDQKSTKMSLCEKLLRVTSEKKTNAHNNSYVTLKCAVIFEQRSSECKWDQDQAAENSITQQKQTINK